MDHPMKTDFSRLWPGTLLTFTDFAANVVLRAAQAKNSSIDGHTVNNAFVCVWNRRTVDVKDKKMENDVEIEFTTGVQIFTIDILHFFAKTLSKGKKNVDNSIWGSVIVHYCQEWKLVILQGDMHTYRD